MTPPAPQETADSDDDDEVAVDIDEYSQQVQDTDPATVVTSKPIESEKRIPVVQSSAVLQTRRYDLNITYDKYYQTPRFVVVCLFVCLLSM